MRLVYVPVIYLSLLVGWGKYINDTKSNPTVFFGLSHKLMSLALKKYLLLFV